MGGCTQITAEFVRSILEYDPEAGQFFWKARAPEAFGNLRAFRMWHAKNCGKKAGYVDGNGYIALRFLGANNRAHRIAWLHYYGDWPRGDLDHINGNRQDFRITNLREATPSQNAMNRRVRRTSRSGKTGVVFHKRIRKWQVYIAKSGVQYHIGYFDTFEEGSYFRDYAASYHHGEFARAA